MLETLRNFLFSCFSLHFIFSSLAIFVVVVVDTILFMYVINGIGVFHVYTLVLPLVFGVRVFHPFFFVFGWTKL